MASASSLPLFVSVLLLLLTLIELSQAAPQLEQSLTASPASKTTTAPTASATSTCGFKGDDNTYGLGIRLGVYIQWIISSIAYNFIPGEAVTMRGVNTCFTLANFAGLLYITFSRGANQVSGELYVVECWIVLTFCLGGVCSGRIDNDNDGHQMRTATFAWYRASAIGTIIHITLGASVIFYTIWFLYIGMDTMLAPVCSRSAFFFAKVDIFGWFRIFLKVVFTMSAAVLCTFLLWLAFGLIMSRRKTGIFKTIAGPLGFTEVEKNRKEKSGKLVLKSVGVSFALVFFTLSTELVIRWNHISGVHSIRGTGQLLPVVVAGGGLIRILWKFLIKFFTGAYGL